ncbi:MAG: hypothetical protein O2931_11390 [Planctomycetota bacterium]|nr:hypothetical protein [Planctomycetota bacterium]MDA1179389.1 hypothetical protein [Planctomycetota bacterium]
MKSQRMALVLVTFFVLVGGELRSPAKEVLSGPQLDASLGPFESFKCGGAKADGVENGELVCYRSLYSSRPQVIIFAQRLDEIEELAKKLDTHMESFSELRVFINVLGNDLEATKKRASAWSEKIALKHVAVVVPLEHQYGPEQYQLNKESLLTVVMVRRSRVFANHSVNDVSDIKSLTDAVIADLEKF